MLLPASPRSAAGPRSAPPAQSPLPLPLAVAAARPCHGRQASSCHGRLAPCHGQRRARHGPGSRGAPAALGTCRHAPHHGRRGRRDRHQHPWAPYHTAPSASSRGLCRGRPCATRLGTALGRSPGAAAACHLAPPQRTASGRQMACPGPWGRAGGAPWPCAAQQPAPAGRAAPRAAAPAPRTAACPGTSCRSFQSPRAPPPRAPRSTQNQSRATCPSRRASRVRC
mmetsp:Transcript_7886/g.23778  ORF Transcript_7886/g.23778 Transcript_7886/m.23778 type:complete len:225 (+) Transcript_7886:690-1364(+)